MKSSKIGGPKSFSPSPVTQTPASRPSTSVSSSTSSTSKPAGTKDGFDSVGSKITSSVRGLFGPSHAESFATNPQKFAGQNILNGYKLFPNGKPPQGVALPTPNKPFVPANQSVATMNVQQQHGNANLSLSAPGGNGPQVHYLHYLSSGQGANQQTAFAGINGVPLHPEHGQPSMVMTGPLNGCAVHALHNPADNTLSFVHQADFTKYGADVGKQHLDNFLKENKLNLVQSLTPQHYSHSTGSNGIETGATAFAHYDKTSQQWKLVAQLNDWKSGTSSSGRPELQRPQHGAGLGQWMGPIDVHQPMNVSDL